MKNETNKNSLSEELIEVIKNTKENKDGSFKKLYDLTYPYLYARTKAIFDKDHEVSDIIQEVYILIYKNIKNLKSNESFFSWVNTIIFNTGKTLIKKSPKDILLSEDEEKFFNNILDEKENIENNVIKNSDLEIIRNCIEKLSKEQKEVIIAYYYDNLKLDEIAKILSISTGTVKSRLYFARKKLKELIEKEESKNGYKLYSLGQISFYMIIEEIFKQNSTFSDKRKKYLFNKINIKIKFNSFKLSLINFFKTKKSLLTEKISKIGIKKIVIAGSSIFLAAGIIISSVIFNNSKKNDIKYDKHNSSKPTSSFEMKNIKKQEGSVSKSNSTDNPEISSAQKRNSTNPQSNKTTLSGNSHPSTIVIHQKVRYRGFIGYFEIGENNTVSSNNSMSKFEEYGIPYRKNASSIACPSEYRVDDKTIIYFVGPDIDGEEYMYEIKKNLSAYKYKVKTTDGKGIIPKSNISPSGCKTITINSLTTYLGYQGYFVDENANEGPLKGYASYITEYYNVNSETNLRFVFADKNLDNTEDLAIGEKVRKRGIGTVPVNVTGTVNHLPRESYKYFDKKLNVFDIKERHAVDSGGWYSGIDVYTIEKSPSAELEIKSHFKTAFGYEAISPVFCYPQGYYYIEGQSNACEIYKYEISDVVPLLQNNLKNIVQRTVSNHLWVGMYVLENDELLTDLNLLNNAFDDINKKFCELTGYTLEYLKANPSKFAVNANTGISTMCYSNGQIIKVCFICTCQIN